MQLPLGWEGSTVAQNVSQYVVTPNFEGIDDICPTVETAGLPPEDIRGIADCTSRDSLVFWWMEDPPPKEDAGPRE